MLNLNKYRANVKIKIKEIIEDVKANRFKSRYTRYAIVGLAIYCLGVVTGLPNSEEKYKIKNYNDLLQKQEEVLGENTDIKNTAAQLEANKEEEAKTEDEKLLAIERDNAIKKAENYLKSNIFSKKELIEQLKFEGFSPEISAYAVENISVNWSEECAKKAEAYLREYPYSRSVLYDDLKLEGFSHEEIEYALNAIGLN